MHSAVLLAALTWFHAPSVENLKYIETEARLAAKGANALEVAAAEETIHREAWLQATERFETAYAAYAASGSETDRLAAGHALMALESANLYLRAAMTAREFIAAALLAA